MELGCRGRTPSQKLEAEALPGCPCGMADAGIFCGSGVLSRAVVQGGELYMILGLFVADLLGMY